MTKYYRVRTQEQWDWLVSKLNVCRVEPIDYPMIVCHEQGRRNYSLIKYHKGPEPIIEVSQMMEESRMEDYVTIDSGDFDKIKFDRPQEDGNSFVVKKVNVMGYDTGKYVRDVELPTDLLIPKSLLYPKVPMAEAEKKEFDELKRHRGTVYGALDMIEDDYHKLYTRLFGNSSHEGDSKAQLEFARAWADPSLIEVIPEKKWEVKVPCAPDHYYFKDTDNELIVSYSSDGTESRKQFTSKELKHYGLDNDLFEKVEVSNVKED